MLRRKAIKKYFHNKAEGSQNPADFWKTYRPFLHSRNSGQANDILLKEDGNFRNDKKVLAELFNDYFVNILEDANEITEMDYGTDFLEHPSIREIMHNKVERETFNFGLVNSSPVDLLLSSINSRKSCGYDPTLLKLSAPVVALPVSKIINSSIVSCCYPVRWKMGQVTPLFKKEDELNKKNYLPVTVLPILNNIYESRDGSIPVSTVLRKSVRNTGNRTLESSDQKNSSGSIPRDPPTNVFVVLETGHYLS